MISMEGAYAELNADIRKWSEALIKRLSHVLGLLKEVKTTQIHMKNQNIRTLTYYSSYSLDDICYQYSCFYTEEEKEKREKQRENYLKMEQSIERAESFLYRIANNY